MKRAVQIPLLMMILVSLLLVGCGDEPTATSTAKVSPSGGGLLPFPTPSSNPKIGYASGAVARVNGQEISERDFNNALDQTRVTDEEIGGSPVDWNQEANKQRLKDMREQVLQGLINFTVVAQQAKTEGVTVPESELADALEGFKKQFGGEESYRVWLARRFMSDADYHRTVEQGLLFGKMMEKHSAVEEKGEQVKARHILVSTEQEAKDLYNKLRQGTDFVALARQFSLDTASAPNGGDLDWVFRGQTDENFEKALFALKPGEFSGPIKSELGWHLLKSEAKEVRQLPIDLIQQRKQEAFSNYIKDLRDKAKIEILLK